MNSPVHRSGSPDHPSSRSVSPAGSSPLIKKLHSAFETAQTHLKEAKADRSEKEKVFFDAVKREATFSEITTNEQTLEVVQSKKDYWRDSTITIIFIISLMSTVAGALIFFAPPAVLTPGLIALGKALLITGFVCVMATGGKRMYHDPLREATLALQEATEKEKKAYKAYEAANTAYQKALTTLPWEK